jgi:phosphoribosylglycinamide formyltransferase 1
MKKVKTAILISGRGTNMAALIEAAKDPDYPAQIYVVVSDIIDTPGINHARREGILPLEIPYEHFPDRENFESFLDLMLRYGGVELLCLAGFMRILSASFVNKWNGRIINIHPSLLPDFKGLNTHERALAAGVGEHGCTVHYVVPELDAGPIIAQSKVPVRPDDTPATLAARVLEAENRLYPEVLAKVAREIQQKTDR